MSKIEGRAHDDLLLTKGYGGFPTLAFMDADGEVLGQPTDRSVEAFAACRDALQVIDAVTAKAEAGDPEAKAELLLLEHSLGRVNAEAFAARAETVRGGANQAQLARIDQALVDNEVWELVGESYRGDAEAAGASMLALLDAGKRPSATGKYGGNFWGILGRWARPKGDPSLLRRIATGMREDFPDDKGMLRMANGLEEMATGLDNRDALVARQEGGEEGLEAKILLIEVELGALTLEELRKRLPAARDVATDEEKQALAQGEADMEFKQLVDSFWGGGDRSVLGKRMFDLLSGDGLAPSENIAAPMWSCLSVWASGTGEKETMRAVAAVLRKRYKDNTRVERTAKSLEDRADKL